MVNMSNLLLGKRVVVTGGAGLLGRHLCAAVAQQGGLVIVADLNREAANQVAAGIIDRGGRASGRAIDITSGDSVNQLIKDLHAEFGGVDAVVNNAYPKSQNYGRRFEDVEYSDMCDSLSIHLAGYFLVAQKFAQYFKLHGGGNIVNMSSIYGFMSPRFDIYRETAMTMPVEYALIKSGVIQLTRYIAQYYKSTKVRCNAVSPGGVADGQPDNFVSNYNAFCATKGMLDPEDVSGPLLFLLSDNAMYVNGQNLVVDDGFSL